MDERITVEIIERWLKNDDWRVRAAAMTACQGRDVPVEIIERWLKDEDWKVRTAAMNACQGQDVPIEIIERGLKDDNWRVRAAALNACQGRDVPIEIIERGLKDDDCDVRAAALNACQGQDVSAFKRTFEPPEIVYKKCINDVIVLATIPENAFVRGSKGEKCRSSQAKIIDVIGDVGGVKVGISIFDKKTMYFPGDEITIDDFDMSATECSTGFHFFAQKKKQKSFILKKEI